MIWRSGINVERIIFFLTNHDYILLYFIKFIVEPRKLKEKFSLLRVTFFSPSYWSVLFIHCNHTINVQVYAKAQRETLKKSMFQLCVRHCLSCVGGFKGSNTVSSGWLRAPYKGFSSIEWHGEDRRSTAVFRVCATTPSVLSAFWGENSSSGRGVGGYQKVKVRLLQSLN